MELRQLEMLLAVAEEGSYVQAGKRLNISHSAIHRQIRLLEEEVRERVMVRTGRNVEVTEAGKLLVSLARRVERDITHTSAEVRELSNLQSGTLRIGTGTRTIFNRFDCTISADISCAPNRLTNPRITPFLTVCINSTFPGAVSPATKSCAPAMLANA
jgi:DNA-binding transcriptional LysR family regulator